MTLTLPAFCRPVSKKLFWIRTNRVLAWGLLLSPVLQAVVHMNLAMAVLIDLALLAAHGVLSLALFGTPADRERGWQFLMHVMGFRAQGLSERNRFLLSGYRIALSTGALALAFSPLSTLGWFACLFAFYPILRQPFTVLQHIWWAVMNAMRRWGYRDMGTVAGQFAAFAYVVIWIANLGH